MRLKIIFVFLCFLMGTLASEREPGGPVQANLSNKTIQGISTILISFAVFLAIPEETRILSILLVFFTLFFAVVADSETVDPCLSLRQEIDQLKKEKEQVTDKVQKYELEMKIIRIQIEEYKLQIAKIEERERERERQEKEKEKEKEKEEVVQVKISAKKENFKSLTSIRKQLVEKACLEINQTTISLNDVLSSFHPEYFDSVSEVSFGDLEFEIGKSNEKWIDAQIKAMKSVSNLEEFYQLSIHLFDKFDKQVKDCKTAVLVWKEIEYFSRHVDFRTMKRMIQFYVDQGYEKEKLNLFNQLVQLSKAFFFVVEPIKFEVAKSQVFLVIISATFLMLVSFNVGKIRRKIGDISSVILSALAVIVIAVVFMF